MTHQPATLDQIQRGVKSPTIQVEKDVLNIADQLYEIDPRLVLRWNERGGYFVVALVEENGDESLVTTAKECDRRILERVRYISSDAYDFVADLERMERERKRAQDERFHEQVGEAGERLYHALVPKPKLSIAKALPWRK